MIENVVLFVADSLRLEYLPDDIRSQGVCFKTVAQSTHSPPSFTTLSTGLYPFRHGVKDFNSRLPSDVKTTYDIDSLDTSYYSEGRTFDMFLEIFDITDWNTLADLDPPFWYLERDITPHFPYKGPFMEDVDPDSLLPQNGDWGAIKHQYRKSIERTVERFTKRVEALERLGVKENTLIVFTADHGEFFGEYGEVLHSYPMAPEVVYVPTIFIHPSLSRDDFHVDPSTEIIEHTDVVESCLAAIGQQDTLQTDGCDIFSQERGTRFGYSETQHRFSRWDGYSAEGLWWYDSGVVNVTNEYWQRLLFTANRVLRGPSREFLRKNLGELYKTYQKESVEYGDPPITMEDAIELMEEMKDGVVDEQREELSKAQKKRLRDIGYLQ